MGDNEQGCLGASITHPHHVFAFGHHEKFTLGHEPILAPHPRAGKDSLRSPSKVAAMARTLALSLLLVAACQTPATSGQHPDLVANDQKIKAGEEERRALQAVLVRLDQAIDSYVQAVNNQGEVRADTVAERLERLIRETVLDNGPTPLNPPGNELAPPREPGENFRQIRALAADGSDPDNQKIALAALGFSGVYEVMPTILQGAQLSDPFVVEGALLGLAVLRAPTTPPGVLSAVVMRQDHPEDGRVMAAWALYRLHTATERTGPILDAWKQFLAAADTMPAGVLVQAVRGIGHARDAGNAALVVPFLQHPVPRLRMAAAVSIGRMNAQQYWQEVLALLTPAETSQNVRLHASKALAELAGGVDHGYDVPAWRKTFDRGQ